MNQNNDFMKQITDTLYKDVVQKLEPPLPQVPPNDKNNTTNPIIDTQPPLPPSVENVEGDDEEGIEFKNVPGEKDTEEEDTEEDEEGIQFKNVPGEKDTEEEDTEEEDTEEDEEGIQFKNVPGEKDTEEGDTGEEGGDGEEEDTEEEDGDTGEEEEDTEEEEEDTEEEEEDTEEGDTGEEGGDGEEETTQPTIRANSLNFDAIIEENELLLTGNSMEEQQKIVNAALAALLASKQPTDEIPIDDKASQQQIVNAALAALLASKQPTEEIPIDDKANQQQIVNAALAALLASKQTSDEGIPIDDKAIQQQLVNAALAALLASKQTLNDKGQIKPNQRLSQMLQRLEQTKQSGLSGISTMKASMKEMYKNIPTIEMPKFMANIFEGLLEPDLEYYNVPESINNKIATTYNDYKVVAIKCNSWDENKYCKEEGGKYYLYSSKDDNPKIIVLDAKGEEIK